MSLELQSIGFKADTSELLNVIKVLDDVGNAGEKNANKVAKSFSEVKTAVNDLGSKKLDVGLNDDAINKAKAYVEQLNKAVDAITKLPKGVPSPSSIGGTGGLSGDSNNVSDGAKKSVDAVEKLTLTMKILRGEILDTAQGMFFLGEGFTKSQAAQMASLVLMGKTTDEVMKARKAFEDYNRMSGVNPFDKSTSGAYRLTKQVEELLTVQKLQAENTNLTRKEVVDYARDLERVAQLEKSGAIDAKEAVLRRQELSKTYKEQSVVLRQAEAAALSQEKAAKLAGDAELKKARDIASAQQYVTNTLEKLDYQLALVQEGFGKGASNAAFRFEQSLKQLGLTVSEQERLLKRFADGQTRIAEKQKKDNIDYISRAVAPQITDIFVGLSTGQSPLTVMLQQGGQLRDMFGQMKVDSKDMADVMSKSMYQMVDSIKGVGVAMVQLVTKGFTSMAMAPGKFVANAVTDLQEFVIKATQGEKAAKEFRTALETVGDSADGISKLSGRIATLTSYIAGFVGVGVAGLAVWGASLYETTKREGELSKAIYTTGAMLGLTTSEAMNYVKTVNGFNSSSAIEALTEFAKVGGFTKEQFLLAKDSVVLFSKVTGQSISDVVKQYKELEKDPVKALYELNKAMGTIPNAAIEQVDALQRAGHAMEAMTLATKLMAEGQKKAAETIKGEYVGIAELWNNLKESFKWVVDGVNTLTSITSNTEALTNSLIEIQRIKKDTSLSEYDRETMLTSMYIKRDALVKKINADRLSTTERQKNAEEAGAKSTLDSASKTAELVLQSYRVHKMTETEFYDTELKKRFGKDTDYIKKNLAATSQFAQVNADIQMKWQEEVDRRNKEANRGKNKTDTDTLKLLKNSFQEQYSVLNAELNAQEEIAKKYHAAGILNDQQYFETQTALMREANADRLALISKFEQDARKLGDKGTSLLTQLAKAKDILGVDAIKHYSVELANAIKPMNDFHLKLKDIVEESKQLQEQAKARKSVDILEGIVSPEELIRMKAVLDMQEKVSQKKRELESEFNRAKSKADSVGGIFDAALLDKGAQDRIGQLGRDLQKAEGNVQAATQALADFNAEQARLTQQAGVEAVIKSQTDRFGALAAEVQKINLGQSLASGFNQASNSIAGMIQMIATLAQTEKDYQTTKEQYLLDDSKSVKDVMALEAAHGKIAVKQFGDMAGAAKGYFAEHTAGYKILGAFEGIFKTIQLAEAAYTVVSTAQSAMRAAAAGVEALAMSLTGAPPPVSFGMFAATAAALAAIGVAVSGAFSGGGGSFASTNTGTGTVKGDPSAQSASISNSLKLLSDVDTMTMKYSSKMLVSLKAIESNTSGLADLLISSGAIQTNASSAGIQTGFKKDSFGNAISAGYNAMNKVVSNIPGVGSILAGINGAIGNFVSGLFGTKTSIKGQGFNIGGQSLSSILGGGLSAQYYTDVEKKKKFLGMTTSVSNKTYYTEADNEFKNQITLVFKSFADSIKVAGDALGLAAQDVTKNLNSYVVDLGRVATSGLSGTALQERLQAVFSALGDNMAKAVLPGFDQFQKVGEGYYETVVRVATGVEQATNALDQFGITAIKYSQIQNKQGDVASEIARQSILATESLTGIKDIISSISGSYTDIISAYSGLIDVKNALKVIGISGNAVSSSLITGAGSFENLQDALSAFQDNFLTDAQKLAGKTEVMKEKFNALGLVMPTTAEGFVALVKSIDTSSESGQKLLGRVLGLSDGFSQITTSISEAAQATKEFTDNIIAYVNGLDSSSSNLGSNFNQAKSMFASQIALIQGGDTSARNDITSYADKLLAAAKASASSALEYQTILGSVKSELLGLTTGNYANTVLSSDVTSSAVANTATATETIAQQTESTQQLLTAILDKLTEMQTEDRAEGQASVTNLTAISKVIKRVENGDSLRVAVV